MEQLSLEELIKLYDEQIEIYNENKVKATKVAAGKVRKATMEMAKIGKYLRKASVAANK